LELVGDYKVAVAAKYIIRPHFKSSTLFFH
jgi:hypothetical protein